MKCPHCTQGYVQDAGFAECEACGASGKLPDPKPDGSYFVRVALVFRIMHKLNKLNPGNPFRGTDWLEFFGQMMLVPILLLMPLWWPALVLWRKVLEPLWLARGWGETYLREALEKAPDRRKAKP